MCKSIRRYVVVICGFVSIYILYAYMSMGIFTCIHVYVLVCVCMYKAVGGGCGEIPDRASPICTGLHIDIYTPTHRYIDLHISVLSLSFSLSLREHVYYMHIHIHIYIYVCICIHVYVNMYLYICTCICVYIYI